MASKHIDFGFDGGIDGNDDIWGKRGGFLEGVTDIGNDWVIH
jgi:hypothetical protein